MVSSWQATAGAAGGDCQDADWQKILAPVMELGSKAQKACDPRSDFFQHRKACAESLNIIMLVTSPSPPSHVQSVLETFDFHAMKVMQKKVEKETNWIKAVKESLKALKEWCTETCKLGVTWNVKGQVAMEYFIASPLGSGGKGGSAAPQGKAKGKGKGPPPPKGGFAAMPEELRAKLRQDNETAKAAPAGAGMSAVFNAIGGFNTSQLKKVGRCYQVAAAEQTLSGRPAQLSRPVRLLGSGADESSGICCLLQKVPPGLGPERGLEKGAGRQVVLLLTVPFGILAPRRDSFDAMAALLLLLFPVAAELQILELPAQLLEVLPWLKGHSVLCAEAPRCAKLGLEGYCCPGSSGESLDCCFDKRQEQIRHCLQEGRKELKNCPPHVDAETMTSEDVTGVCQPKCLEDGFGVSWVVHIVFGSFGL
ncbi:unnamed protein product [Effrenium voratum]|nr:unnamed protein product [Effrenium voratum]